MAAARVIAFFSAAVFLGKVAFSATGFATAIVFLFLYQLGSLAWLDCCNIRYAVFILTIGFVVIIPITLWRSNLRDNIRAELLAALFCCSNHICRNTTWSIPARFHSGRGFKGSDWLPDNTSCSLADSWVLQEKKERKATWEEQRIESSRRQRFDSSCAGGETACILLVW